MKEYKLCWDIELERIKMKTLNGRQNDNDDMEILKVMNYVYCHLYQNINT